MATRRLNMELIRPAGNIELRDEEVMENFKGSVWVGSYLGNEVKIYQQPATFYGFITEGDCRLRQAHLPTDTPLCKGMWFCIPAHTDFVLRGGRGVLVRFESSDPEPVGLPSLGGPIEEVGRLRYIDGCTDSLLAGPPLVGDPCLNHLHFPKGITQTMHTHPSLRCGVVARGNGHAVVPAVKDSGYEVHDHPKYGKVHLLPLTPNTCWVLPKDGQHCFVTEDDTMDVIAFHPDSDTGPGHEDHPMLNRTYVDDVSARHLKDIHTNAEEAPHPA